MRNGFLCSFFLCFVLVSVTQAATITVQQNGTGDYTTINSALAVAQDGDVISVGPGTYQESLLVEKSVEIEAESGRCTTVLDGNDSFRIMVVEGNVNVALRGLKFSHGFAGDAAALLIWNQANVNIENCFFVDNYTSGSNAVHVRHYGTRASFYGCEFLRNESAVHSAALSMGFGGNLLVEGCLFADNVSGGVAGAVNCNDGVFDFHGNLFLRNHGLGEGALAIQFSASGQVYRNTFHENSGDSGGAVRINSNTYFWQNIVTNSQGGPGLVSPIPDNHYCNLYYNNEGGSVGGSTIGANEIVSEPYFCDLNSDDYSLCSLSPALEVNNGCGNMGALDMGCTDCGAVATEPQTMGGLKSLYR